MKNEEIAARLDELHDLLMMSADEKQNYLDEQFGKDEHHHDLLCATSMICGVVAAKVEFLARKVREEQPSGIFWMRKYVDHNYYAYDIYYHSKRFRQIHRGERLPKTAQRFMEEAKNVYEQRNDFFHCDEIIYEN